MENSFSPFLADSWRSHVTTTCYWVLGSWWATFSNELKLTKRVHWAQILQKYSGLERETGRSLLESLCRSKHHLKVPDITPNLSAWHFHSIGSLPHLSTTHSHLLFKLNTRSSAIFSIGIKKWEIQSDPELAYLISELDLTSSMWIVKNVKNRRLNLLLVLLCGIVFKKYILEVGLNKF